MYLRQHPNGNNDELSGGPEQRFKPSRRSRYAVAFLLTAFAAAIVGAVDLTLSFPPFLIFAIAAGLAWLFCGAGPAMFSIALAVLLSDFMFLQPRYELSLNKTTAGLAAVYASCAALSRVAAYRTKQQGWLG